MSVDVFLRTLDRFEVGGECWTWLGSKTTQGYGQAFHQKVHRLAYTALVGPIPLGMELDHLCRNRACLRPSHLEPVSHRENLLRGNTFAARNARKDACPQGHPYDASARGRRVCSACSRAAVDRSRQKGTAK